jgi:hypothetical protein
MRLMEMVEQSLLGHGRATLHSTYGINKTKETTEFAWETFFPSSFSRQASKQASKPSNQQDKHPNPNLDIKDKHKDQAFSKHITGKLPDLGSSVTSHIPSQAEVEVIVIFRCLRF